MQTVDKSEVVVKEVYNGVLDFYVDYGFASSIYDDWFWKIFMKKAPKEINSVFGYRTSMSMKNKDTWDLLINIVVKSGMSVEWLCCR